MRDLPGEFFFLERSYMNPSVIVVNVQLFLEDYKMVNVPLYKKLHAFNKSNFLRQFS